MLINKYLKATFAVVAFDSIFLTFTYSALLDSSVTTLILGARIVIDITFLVLAWRHILLRKIEVALIFMVLLSSVCAALPSIMFSAEYSINRFFNDISGPLLFLLKASALRALFLQQTSTLNIKKLSRALIILSVIQILIFVYFSAQTGAYAGISLPINLPVAWYVGTFNHLGLVATLILIILSGKRSFFISIAIVSALAIVLKGSRRNKIVLFVMMGAVVFSLMVIGNDKVNGTVTAANELLGMIEVHNIDLNSENFRSGLYLLTAGRSEEFYGILSEMRPWSWLIGLGPGFTYSYLHTDGIVDGYANSHFSPLSLTYKFGLVFAILFYSYITSTIRELLKISDSISFILGCALLLFILQSFFAFNLYVEPYFPILLGLGMAIASTANRNKK